MSNKDNSMAIEQMIAEKINGIMRIIFTLLFCSIVSQVAAQNGKLYKGTINNKLKIALYLEGLNSGTHADPIVGSYKYDHGEKYILLNGYLNHQGNITLVEFSTVNFSGTFLGTIKNNSITGKWISANQKTSYTFELSEVGSKKGELVYFQNAIKDKANEFSSY